MGSFIFQHQPASVHVGKVTPVAEPKPELKGESQGPAGKGKITHELVGRYRNE